MVMVTLLQTFAFFCFLGTLIGSVYSEINVDKLDSDIAKIHACKTNPALAVSVVRQGKIVFSRGYGYANPEKKILATNKTIFGIASLSKAFAATLLLKLLQQSKISLKTPVVDVLGSDFRFEDDMRTKYATIEDLLAHRLGIPANNNLRFDTNLTRANLPERLRYLKATGQFRNSYIYSNLMYGVITYIAERIGGTTWEKLVKEQIFDPLRMTSSTFTTIKKIKSRDVAQPIAVYGETEFSVDTEFTRRWGLLCGSGCVMSTANDMAKWMHFHLSHGLDIHGKRVMDRKVMATMYTPRNTLMKSSYRYFVRPLMPVTTSADIYGLGWRRGYYRGYPTITHTGSTFGYRAIILLIPSKKVGVFVVATGNDDNYLLRVSLTNYVTDVVLGETPWLNTSTLCSFPKPWFDLPVTKYKLPASSVPYAKQKTAYEGVFVNKAYGNLEVYFNATLRRIIVQYGFAKWALYPISGPADTFYGKGIDINSVKDCHVIIFRSGDDAPDLTIKIEAQCFESRLPPVFIREGYNSATSTLTSRTNALSLATFIILQTSIFIRLLICGL